MHGRHNSPVRFTFSHLYRSDSEIADILDAAGVETILDQAADRIGSRLTGPVVPVQVELDVPDIIIPDHGFGGWADPARDGLVVFAIDSSRLRDPARRSELLVRLGPALSSTLAHEGHHAVRIIDGPGWGRTLGEAIVSEGLAEAFAQEVYPDQVPPWIHAYPESRDAELWTRAREVWDRPWEEQMPIWMFGGDVVPNGTGYTMGFRMVRSYVVRHPDSTAGSLVTTPAEEIVRECGFPSVDSGVSAQEFRRNRVFLQRTDTVLPALAARDRRC